MLSINVLCQLAWNLLKIPVCHLNFSVIPDASSRCCGWPWVIVEEEAEAKSWGWWGNSTENTDIRLTMDVSEPAGFVILAVPGCDGQTAQKSEWTKNSEQQKQTNKQNILKSLIRSGRERERDRHRICVLNQAWKLGKVPQDSADWIRAWDPGSLQRWG